MTSPHPPASWAVTHNVHIVSEVAQRAMKEACGAGGRHWIRKVVGERTEIARAAHADWTQDGSRISTGERRAGRGVGPWYGLWSGGASMRGKG
jgi:hypothetical protein